MSKDSIFSKRTSIFRTKIINLTINLISRRMRLMRRKRGMSQMESRSKVRLPMRRRKTMVTKMTMTTWIYPMMFLKSQRMTQLTSRTILFIYPWMM